MRTPDKDWVSTAEAAALLGISRQRVNMLIHDGKLEAIGIGRFWLVSRASVKHRMSEYPPNVM